MRWRGGFVIAGARRPKQDAGFSLVEILIAVGVLTTAASGLVWSLGSLQKANTVMRETTALMDLEGSLVNALLNEDNYANAAVKASLRSGQIPANWKIDVSGVTGGNAFDFKIEPNTNQSFDEHLNKCANYPSKTCTLLLELFAMNVAGGPAFAYRLSANQNVVSLSYGGAGTGLSSATLASDEFKVKIPYDYYLASKSLACPSQSIGINGINPSTGQATCIGQPTKTCANGSLPKSLRYDSAFKTIEFDCGPPEQTATCPSGYFLWSIDTTSLDGASSHKVGQCIYAGAHTVHTTLGPAKRVVGRVCPQGYKSASVCRVEASTITSKAGSCSLCTADGLDCASASTPIESPIGSGSYSQSIPYICTSGTAKATAANPGRAILQKENDPEGSLDCYYQKAQQDCGANYDAKIVVDVTCTISSKPELVDVQ